ncbi:MAG TPA: peptidoglycan-associated lipoprotein Pal [Syntrophales bacterium]|nr:peptidoglycan-associated lipoprotein Pal [Syntrophales bacterium]HON23731.1 peptidoglycan-associated lipoprotein Pal [Syntrophales bacterium]
MMKRAAYGLLFLAVLCLAFTGCASKKAYTPLDLNADLQSGKLVQKANNFVVLLDHSSSMNDPYKGVARHDIAQDVTERMVKTIPEIPLTAGLRTFWADKTKRLYGMEPLNKDKYIAQIDTVEWGSGQTPMGKALTAAGDEDLKGLAGKSAVIVVSDFEHIENVDDLQPKAVMAALDKIKADYGDRVCVYTIHVDNDAKGNLLAGNIVKAAGCGEAVLAEDLTDPEAMKAFVQRVFLAPAPVKAMAPAAAPLQERAQAAAAKAAAPAAVAAAFALDNIHFDFDKSSLRPEDRKILKGHADWLMKNKDVKIIVEGHCDERGTTEYNLALGERRATETKKYLVELGVAADRIKTISYGEERPLDPGHNEQAWAKNRRAQFVLNNNP